MIPDIKELNFAKKNGKQYATMEQATVTLADMGEKTITSLIRIDGDIIPDFSYDWAVEFQGEKYIMPLRIPAGSKDNTSFLSTIDLTFQHWAIYQLKRWPFVTIQPIDAGTYIADNEVASVSLNLKDFCILFGQVLEYYYGNAITIDLNPAWKYDETPIFVEINHTKIWNVLTETLYPKYGARWEIKPAAVLPGDGPADADMAESSVSRAERATSPTDAYVIRVGYPTTEVSHVFEYGFEGGLLKVERQVQSEEIRNMLKGRGGETNIPFRYFKDTDPNNPDFEADPDWVEELENIYFANLMGATFRSYVQGWKAQHISDYPGYTAVGESNAYSAWAYRKGYTDTKFSPVEFVADEITLNPTSEDKQTEILPGYAPYIKADSSIAKYGPLPDTLDNNDEIYPTIQGTGLDIAVDVEQITSDEPQKKDAYAEISIVAGVSTSATLASEERKTLSTDTATFSVPSGKTGNLIVDASTPLTYADKVEVEEYTVEVYDSSNRQCSASGLPSGTYSYRLIFKVHNTTKNSLVASFGVKTAKLMDAVLSTHPEGTFDIWIKDIWGSVRQAGESDTEYSERIWLPILGDRDGNEAKVMFTTGNLVHEDYEFVIVGFPKPDTSKTWMDSEGKTHMSMWRITLAKSDAELEATGLYLPNTKRQGNAGDRFIFTGTEMTHHPYVTDAEVRLDDWKKDNLADKKEIKPTFVVTPDRVRINNEGKANALIDQLRVGNSITLRSKQFIDGSQEVNLYLQAIKYTYRKPSKDDAALNPDVEITLGNDYSVTANPVSMMQGEITALQRQIGSISNVEQIVRAVGDRKYLRKDRADRTPYALTVGGTLTAEDAMMAKSFMSGLMGWRIDQRGNAELESLTSRSFLKVFELIYNRMSTIEGDTLFTEGDTIETVTDNGNGTYTLKLHEKWEGYFTAQYEHNVIKGIYNNITPRLTPGQGQQSVNNALYYTSWMNILSVDTANNEITVTLYPDDEVPGGKNFPPADMMKIARWGNSGDSEDAECAKRQTCMYISSTEGRIVKLFRVTKPILDEGNVACSLGTIPEFLLAIDARLKPDDDVLYAKTVISQSLIHVDYKGRPVPTVIDRGPWKAGEKYYDGTTRNESGVYERSKTWDNGHGWLANTNMTAAEANRPSWNTAYWTHVEGDTRLTAEFTGFPPFVNPAKFKITGVVHTFLGNVEISDQVLDSDVTWSRYSEDSLGNRRTASDRAWDATHAAAGKTLTLTQADLDATYGLPPVCVFTATVNKDVEGIILNAKASAKIQ